MDPKINPADTTWMLVATALVLLMTPALGFFYAGMVRSKNALNTLMMSMGPLAFVGLAWALVGYSIAFGHEGRMAGGLEFALLRNVGPRTTAARRSFRRTCHSLSSAPGFSGSDGSDSTAAARSPPTRPPLWHS